MPTDYQTNAAVLAAIQRETVRGTAATDSSGSASQLRLTDSPGLKLTRQPIQSQEKRVDQVVPMGRLGSRSVAGSFNGEMTVGGAMDILLEAIMRGVWTAAVAITQATMTSITTTTNTIVAAGGSWLTQGVRVGDILVLTGHATTANNNLNLRATGVTASTITVAGTPLTADAVADTSFTLTILKKLKTPTSPTRYTHTVEQYNRTIDLSQLFLGCRVTELDISFKPNNMATFTATLMGVNRTILVAGTSPYFTAPSVTTGLSLVADDSSIRYNGADVASFTGFDLKFAIAASADPVIGSTVPPDVFDNDLTVSGTVTGLLSDFADLTAYDAETEFEISILLEEPTTAPKSCIGIFIPRAKISDLDVPHGGGDGPKVVTKQLMIGPKVAATGYDGTVANIFSSAA